METWKAIAMTVALLTLLGCAPTVRYSLPPLAEEAVPKLSLDSRPTLDLTDAEILAIWKASPSATGKIAKNQIRWKGFADVADVVITGYQSYIRTIFTPIPVPKKWWQFWWRTERKTTDEREVRYEPRRFPEFGTPPARILPETHGTEVPGICHR
jgi:hypothetical protein